jgi:NAD-dependent DNA ligase
MEEAGLSKKLSQKIHIKQFDESNPLFGKTIILTGFRDNDLQNELKEIGAKIGASVSKSTFIVIVKDLDEATTKVDEAKKLGISIMTVEQFREKYL